MANRAADLSSPSMNYKRLSEDYFNVKTKIHDILLDKVDLSVVEKLDENLLRTQVRNIVNQIIREEINPMPLNLVEREMITRDIENEIMGLGPLEPFLEDPTVSDILVNTYDKIYVERFGKLEETPARFKDNDHLLRIIDKIVTPIGRRVDESSPMVDARLKDGSRVNAIIPPLALDGPILSIRRFAVTPLEEKDLIILNTFPEEIVPFLTGIVKARLNVLISGGTGSGKTTFLNVLSRSIPNTERIVTIEDAAELQLQQDHIVRLETRPPNIEGMGKVTQRDLVRNSLRMRPDRIIVGEVRGEEALDMLQAMNTGHEGSLTTIHANSARDALIRLETMLTMAGFEIPTKFMRRYISSAIDVIIHLARLADGTRKLIGLIELTGMEGDVITMQEIFNFKQTGIDQDMKVKGEFRFNGIRPRFLEKFSSNGIEIPPQIFDTALIKQV